ncbi:MAG: hypothetical protein VXX33_17770, partial [Pseudomonadota bacterium]|nr:hypothetical protein [Pseudomonadota bacterium]
CYPQFGMVVVEKQRCCLTKNSKPVVYTTDKEYGYPKRLNIPTFTGLICDLSAYCQRWRKNGKIFALKRKTASILLAVSRKNLNLIC